MAQGGRVSLREIMGKKADRAESSGLHLGDLDDLLGDDMPELSFDRVGRVRLISALRNRLGDNFRNKKGIQNLLKEFDEEMAHQIEVKRLRLQREAEGGMEEEIENG